MNENKFVVGIIVVAILLMGAIGIFGYVKISHARSESQARVDLAERQVSTAISSADQQINLGKYEVAIKTIQTAQSELNKMVLPSKTVTAITDKLDKKLSQAKGQQADYQKKMSHGWSVFEGRFMSPSEKDTILKDRERQRREEADRAERERQELANQDVARPVKPLTPVAKIEPPKPTYEQGNLDIELARMQSLIQKEFPYLPPEKLIGQTFIVSPNSAYEDNPRKEYFDLNVYTGKGSLYSSNNPIYADVVGKRCTVVDITSGGMEMVIMMSQGRKKYSMRSSIIGEKIDGDIPVVLASDVDNAKKRWQGKTLWFRGKSLTSYVKKFDEIKIVEVKVRPYSPVKVLDVTPGSFGPVDFLVQTETGEKGRVDVVLSGSTSEQYDHWLFWNNFFEEDPHKLLPHSDKVWKMIEEEAIAIGWNAEQVRLSWGQPTKVNRTISAAGRDEQWVYGENSRQYVYFTDGVVRSMQN